MVIQKPLRTLECLEKGPFIFGIYTDECLELIEFSFYTSRARMVCNLIIKKGAKPYVTVPIFFRSEFVLSA